jgi:hypothetical protein
VLLARGWQSTVNRQRDERLHRTKVSRTSTISGALYHEVGPAAVRGPARPRPNWSLVARADQALYAAEEGGGWAEPVLRRPRRRGLGGAHLDQLTSGRSPGGAAAGGGGAAAGGGARLLSWARKPKATRALETVLR